MAPKDAKQAKDAKEGGVELKQLPAEAPQSPPSKKFKGNVSQYVALWRTEDDEAGAWNEVRRDDGGESDEGGARAAFECRRDEVYEKAHDVLLATSHLAEDELVEVWPIPLSGAKSKKVGFKTERKRVVD